MGRLITDLGRFDPAQEARQAQQRKGMPTTVRKGSLDVAFSPELEKMGYGPGDITQDTGTGLYIPKTKEDEGVPREKAVSIKREDEHITRYLFISGLHGNMQSVFMLDRLLSNPSLKYDAIVCFGNLGEKTEELFLLFNALAGNPQKRPVYAMPCAVESMDVWKNAADDIKKNEQFFDMTAYDPRVRSNDHHLLFLPGSLKPYTRNGYAVVHEDDPKTQTIKREDESSIRVINLEEYLGMIDMSTASRHIIITGDMPKFEGENGQAAEDAIDYQEVIDIKDSSGVVKYKSVSARYTDYAKQQGFEVDGPRKENIGSQEFADALKSFAMKHMITCGNDSTSHNSCDSLGNRVGEDWSNSRYLNCGSFNEGWVSLIEVRETPEGVDCSTMKKMPDDYGLSTRAKMVHLMHGLR